MKAKQAMEILGVSRPTLYKYVKQGIIKVDATINNQHFYNDLSVYAAIGKEAPDIERQAVQNRKKL